MRSANVPTPAAHRATIHCNAGLAGDDSVDSIEASTMRAVMAPVSGKTTAALLLAPAKASFANVSAGSNTQASRAPQATA